MPAWTPARISTALWLDASDASTLYDATSGGSLVAADGAIARFEDKSGNARHFTQSSSTLRTIRKTAIQNGLGVVRLDGTNDYMDSGAISAFATDQIADFVIVIWRNTTAANQHVFRSAYTSGASTNSNTLHGVFRTSALAAAAHARTSTGSLVASTVTISSGTYLHSSIWASDDTVTLRVDGAAATAGTGANASPSGHTNTRLGANSGTLGEYAAIDVCEWVRVLGGVSTDTRDRIEGYLAWKWGIQSSLPSDHAYKNARPIYGASGLVNSQSLVGRGDLTSGRQLVGFST